MRGNPEPCRPWHAVRQSVRRTRISAEIVRSFACVFPEEKPQTEDDCGLTMGAARTQNPLPARACGFNSHLRYCRNHGEERGSRSSGPSCSPPEGVDCEAHCEAHCEAQRFFAPSRARFAALSARLRLGWLKGTPCPRWCGSLA